MAKTTKDKLEAGDKRRAGTLLSNFLRQIAQEKVAGEKEVMTKAEALARQIWNRALGRHAIGVDNDTGKIIYEKPDKSMIDIIFDRTEGRVGTFEEEKKKGEDIPSKVSRKNKARINKMSTDTNKKKDSLKSK